MLLNIRKKTAGEWEIGIGMLTTLRYCWMFEVCHFEKEKKRLGPLNWGKNTNWIKLEEGDLSDNQLTDIPSEIAELTQKQTNTKTKTIFETVASKWGNKLTSCTK